MNKTAHSASLVGRAKSALRGASPSLTLFSRPTRSTLSRGFSYTRFSIKDRTLFAKRLAFLMKAGVPVVECLHLIRKQTASKGKARVYDAVIRDLANGQFLATALGKFRPHFGDFTINLIRVGEQSGILSQNLSYLADELQKKHALQRKVRSALVYPVFITLATLGVTSLLTVFIFPKIMPIFTSLNVPLPLTTRALLWVSTFLANWGLVLALGLIALAVGYAIARKKILFVRYWSDWLSLRIPLFGTLVRTYNLANFSRTLGLLLKSGVHLTEALAITAETTTNLIYKEAYLEAQRSVVKGEQLSRQLERRRQLFPDMLPHMVHIGETTGALSSSLTYLSESYEAEVEEQTKNLSSSIEPVLMIVMGILVGLIAVSVITPIYEITQHLNPRR